MASSNALTVYKTKGKDLALREIEQFTTGIGNVASAKDITSFALTGAGGGVGTTTISENLAKALAASGERVILVCVNAQKTTEEKLPLIDSVESLLLKAQQGADRYYQIEIPAGALPVISPKNDEPLRSFMQEIDKRFSYVVWDLPPVDVTAQSRMICQLAQGVIIVIEAGRTRWHSARHALNTLELAKANVLGVVLNKKKNYIPQWMYRMFFRYDF